MSRPNFIFDHIKYLKSKLKMDPKIKIQSKYTPKIIIRKKSRKMPNKFLIVDYDDYL